MTFTHLDMHEVKLLKKKKNLTLVWVVFLALYKCKFALVWGELIVAMCIV